MIGLPPLSAGAVQVTVASSWPALALTAVGAPGAVGAVGVTGSDAAESGPVPIALIAATVKVYAVPAVSPVIVFDPAGAATLSDVCAVAPM